MSSIGKIKANKLNKNSSVTVHPSVCFFFPCLPEVHLIHGRDNLSVFITLKLSRLPLLHFPVDVLAGALLKVSPA